MNRKEIVRTYSYVRCAHIELLCLNVEICKMTGVIKIALVHHYQQLLKRLSFLLNYSKDTFVFSVYILVLTQSSRLMFIMDQISKSMKKAHLEMLF